MTLDLEALKRVAKALHRRIASGKSGWMHCEEMYAFQEVFHAATVLDLLARVEALEQGIATDPAPYIVKAVKAARAAGFREGVSKALEIVEARAFDDGDWEAVINVLRALAQRDEAAG